MLLPYGLERVQSARYSIQIMLPVAAREMQGTYFLFALYREITATVLPHSCQRATSSLQRDIAPCRSVLACVEVDRQDLLCFEGKYPKRASFLGQGMT